MLRILGDDMLYTLEEVFERTEGLERSTVKYAIRRLLEAGLIKSYPELNDMRTVRYRIASEGDLSRALARLPKEVVSALRPML